MSIALPKATTTEQPAMDTANASAGAAAAPSSPVATTSASPGSSSSPPTLHGEGAAVHHQHHHQDYHYHGRHHPTSPRRNLVPTVVVPVIPIPSLHHVHGRPVVAAAASSSSSSSIFNSAAQLRTRSYSLDNVSSVTRHTAAPPLFSSFRSVPHSPMNTTANAAEAKQLSVPSSFLLQQHQQRQQLEEEDGLLLPPEPSESCRVMEAAVAKERQRALQMEAQEANIINVPELRAILQAERKRMAKMAGDLAVLKLLAVQLQLQAEVTEEGRINGLWRQMDTMQQQQQQQQQQEKERRIIVELEQEEEMVWCSFVHVMICCCALLLFFGSVTSTEKVGSFFSQHCHISVLLLYGIGTCYQYYHSQSYLIYRS
jgi:hypothetical protein